jgi:hypothetical protein
VYCYAELRSSATIYHDGFAHGDDWFAIVWWLCEDLEALVTEAEKATGQRFEVTQVKQKFGGLRFHVTGRTPYGSGSKVRWSRHR